MSIEEPQWIRDRVKASGATILTAADIRVRELTVQRDAARDLAAHLEAENAALRAVVDAYGGSHCGDLCTLPMCVALRNLAAIDALATP